MPDILTQHGLLSLFLLSFCASTLLPLGSEWLLVILLLDGGEPLTAIAVASLGNSLGAVTSYLIGLSSGRWLRQNLLRINQKQQQRAGAWFARYGSWALLFSWLPLVGDPLCLVAGMLRHKFLGFILLVAAGKTARYALVATLTLTGHALA
jgi:membrane protein YqaA with SNARE-associated domain